MFLNAVITGDYLTVKDCPSFLMSSHVLVSKMPVYD